MASTTIVYPDSDHSHPGELESPLPVDGSAYTQPVVIGTDTAGYQGDDSNADAFNSAVLTLPEVEGATATADPSLTSATHFDTDAIFGGNYYPTGNNIAFTLTQDLPEDTVVMVEVFTVTTVASQPSAPTCSDDGPGLTWAQRFHAPNVTDYRPQVTKFWAAVGAAGMSSGDTITVSWPSQYRRDGQISIWTGLDPDDPFETTWNTSNQLVWGYSYPNAPSITVTNDGAVVAMTAGGDAASSGYTTPVVPAGYTEIVNSPKTNSGYRNPVVSAILLDCSPGAYDPPAMTGLDFSNEYAVTEAYTPGAGTDVPALVAVAVSDETATTELVTGDVALTAANEVQVLTSFLTSGTRTLTFDGQTTGSIDYDDSASDVQTALEALSNIASGDVIVTGGPLDEAEILIEFDSTYAETDVATITVSGTNVDPVNEVQSLQCDHTAGTFTLTFGGQTTTALPVNASRSQVQTALEALSSIGLNNVECTGGPLPGDAVLIEFTGDLGGADQSTITVTDSGTGGTTGTTVTEITAGVAGSGMVISTDTVGSAGEDFTLVDSWLTRAGAYEPQIHLFELMIEGYTAGATIDVTVADHDGLHSWAAALFILDANTDPATFVEAIGAEAGATSGTTATFGAVTPLTAGAVVIELLAKAKTTGSYTGTPSAGSPSSGYATEAEALADAMTLLAASGPPVAAAATIPGRVAWSGTEAWATASFALRPATGSSAGTDLHAVLDSEDTDTWIDLAPAAGSMFVVLELDLDTVPTDAVLTGALIELAHSCDVPSQLRVALVGIGADDSVTLAAEQQVGYLPASGGAVGTVTTNYWTTLSSGEHISEYSRLGIALISSARHPALSNHRVYWCRATVRYEEGGPAVSNATGPTDPGDPFTWDYSSDGGYPQAQYRLVVIQGSSQDPDTATTPDDPLSPSTGEIVYDSGLVPGTLVRSLDLSDAPLSRGACTLAVQAWAAITSSLTVASDWSTDNFDITGTPATTPDQSGTEPVYNQATGAVDVTVVAPAAVSRAWLERSTDAGSTWELCEAGPFSVTPSTSNNLSDVYAPAAATVWYRVAFDAGAMTETTEPDTIGTAGADTTPTDVMLIVPSDPTLSMPIEVAAYTESDPRDSIVATGEGGNLVAASPTLGHVINLTVRTRTQADRAQLLTILGSGATLRFVDILGRACLCRLNGDIGIAMQRWAPTSAETTMLRDAFEHTFQLVEVAS